MYILYMYHDNDYWDIVGLMHDITSLIAIFTVCIKEMVYTVFAVVYSLSLY